MKKKTTKKAQNEPVLDAKDVEMTDSEMEQLLIELSESKFWEAYQKYNAYRMRLAEQALFSIDPFKNPTETARSQGTRMGLMDLGIYVAELKRHRNEKNSGAV